MKHDIKLAEQRFIYKEKASPDKRNIWRYDYPMSKEPILTNSFKSKAMNVNKNLKEEKLSDDLEKASNEVLEHLISLTPVNQKLYLVKLDLGLKKHYESLIRFADSRADEYNKNAASARAQFDEFLEY